MTELEEVRQVYREYEAQIGALRQSGRIAGGLLGMGGGPAADVSSEHYFRRAGEKKQQQKVTKCAHSLSILQSGRGGGIIRRIPHPPE